jgi:hypothetical protein
LDHGDQAVFAVRWFKNRCISLVAGRVASSHSLKNRDVAHHEHPIITTITQEAKMKKVLAVALAAGMLAAAGAHAAVIMHITESGGNVNVTASGSLDLTGAVYDHQQDYSTGIIPGGSNWYVALGSTPGLDWYRLTSTTLPFGTSSNYFTSGVTSGDGFALWAFGGMPLVGLAGGYTSGDAIASSMVLTGQSIPGMTLIPGTYTFTLPADTITLEIGNNVPEPASLALMLGGLVAGVTARRRTRA